MNAIKAELSYIWRPLIVLVPLYGLVVWTTASALRWLNHVPRFTTLAVAIALVPLWFGLRRLSPRAAALAFVLVAAVVMIYDLFFLAIGAPCDADVPCL